jgi:hypothetical protein
MARDKPVDLCKLCGNVKELRDSHYLPKRLYTFLRAWQLKNPNPVMGVGSKLKQISDQYRGYVFCPDCEELLNKNGEKWVLANVPKDYDGVFPLHAAINRLTPQFAGEHYVLCNVSGEAGFEIDQLVYFGASIFWRGAVHNWKTSTGQQAPKVDLCGNEESMRDFLLGKGSLPDDIVLTLDIWPYKKVLQMLYPVIPNHLPECQRYWFYVPGLLYALYFGTNIPKGARSRSAADGFVAVDQKAADSVLDYTKRGVKSQYWGSGIEEMHRAIAEVRSKTAHKE